MVSFSLSPDMKIMILPCFTNGRLSCRVGCTAKTLKIDRLIITPDTTAIIATKHFLELSSLSHSILKSKRSKL